MPEPEAASRFETEPSVARRPGFGREEIPEGTINVEDVLTGIVTNMARGETPVTSAEDILNGRVRENWCGPRGGYNEVIAKPDSERVIYLLVYYDVSRTYIVRITPFSVHYAKGSDGWTEILGEEFQTEAVTIDELTGSTNNLTGSIDDLGDVETLRQAPAGSPVEMDSAQLLNRVYITSKAREVIEIDFDDETFAAIEEAPNARFIESFAERLVVGNVRSTSSGAGPSRLVWSGRLEPKEWDATENISAGEVDLSSAPSDAGDAISGLFAIGDNLVILRERSIWEARRLPFAENPFKFRQVVGDQGCDLPYTAEKIGDAIIYADQRTKGVWVYQPGRRPQRVSRQIEDQLYEDLVNMKWAQGAYDPFEQEYHLGIAEDDAALDQISKVWVYSLRHKAWTRDEGQYTALGQLLTRTDITQIDELTGDTDSLSGDIDSLSNPVVDNPAAMRGTETGEVLFEIEGDTTDYDGTAFQFIFQSANFGSLQRRRQLQRLVAHLECITSGDLTIEMSNDGVSWRNPITKTIPAGDWEKMGVRNQNISGDNLWVRFRTTNATPRLLNYWLKILEKGLHRND